MKKNVRNSSKRNDEIKDGALDTIRTCGFLLRRQTLYPLSYKGTVEEIIRYHGRNGKTKKGFERIQWKKP